MATVKYIPPCQTKLKTTANTRESIGILQKSTQINTPTNRSKQKVPSQLFKGSLKAGLTGVIIKTNPNNALVVGNPSNLRYICMV